MLAHYLSDAGVRLIHPVQTNILIADVSGLGLTAARVVEALRGEGVLCGQAAADRVRFVTHLDVSVDAVRTAGEIIARVLPTLTADNRA
jgi:threonine aldolase